MGFSGTVPSLLVSKQRFAGGGGPKKAKMPEDLTDFDVVFVGGANTTALAKFIQNEQDDVNNFWKMALVTDRAK